MISVDEALSKVLDLFSPLPSETVPLRAAAGRVLAADAVADRDQPPFPRLTARLILLARGAMGNPR